MRPLTRIFALAPDCHAEGNRYARLWQRHFYDGLGGAGVQVVTPQAVDFTWARPASSAPPAAPERSVVSQRLWEQIRSSRAEAVVSYCFASDVDPSLVRDTVAAGIPWVNFFCDSTYAFDRVAPLAREASLNWFPEGEAEARYRALGRPFICRPYALNPSALVEAECDVARHPAGFVGASTGNRALRLATLALLGCRVTARGAGWGAPRAGHTPAPPATRPPRGVADYRARGRLVDRILARTLPRVVGAGGALDDDELGRFLSHCRVVLGLNEGRSVDGQYRSYLKLRDIEFPGYGSCYLTQHNGDVARALEVGREVLTFRTMLEAAAQVRRCTRDAAWARAVGRAGRRRVLAEHTWAPRLAELQRAL